MTHFALIWLYPGQGFSMPILGIPSYLYKEPERLTPGEARLNRLRSMLKEGEQRERERERLSQVNRFHNSLLKERVASLTAELDARRSAVERLYYKHSQEQTSRSAELLRRAILRHSRLAQDLTSMRQRADSDRRRRYLAEASASNRRHGLDPTLLGRFPLTIFGTHAIVKPFGMKRRAFKSPLLSIPCLDRAVRREVIFAKGHGGKGHRVRHRMSPWSAIGC